MKNQYPHNNPEGTATGGHAADTCGCAAAACRDAAGETSTLVLEWRHYAKEGQTCERCNDTGANLATVVADYAQRGITITVQEVLLPYDRIHESNLVLINGTPLEELLAGGITSESSCGSCSCLSGQTTSCRTIHYHGVVYEELTAALIKAGIQHYLDQCLAEKVLKTAEAVSC